MRLFPLNVPNALTFVRIMLVPVVVVALQEGTSAGDLVATIVFVAATLTDGLDGFIARTWEKETTFGKVMDPIADKLLVTAALVSLVALDRLAAWAAMVIIAREFAVSGLRIVAGEQGVVIPASVFGKLKTASQFAAIVALIMASNPSASWVDALVYLAVALTLISGVHYFVLARRVLSVPTEGAEDEGTLRLNLGAESPSGTRG
jgi:CDP-diacylglycerol--glycerol-3-phosphate 3-phosphatidyltransferase